MLIVPIQTLMDYESCYNLLKKLFHGEEFACSCGKELPADQCPHKYSSTGLPSYKCRSCGGVFNIFSKTILNGIHYSCIQIVLLFIGFSQGKTTLHLSKELELNYKNLLGLRHKLQEFAYENRDMSCLTDQEVESDEVFINAGEKGDKHENKDDPPRVRANKKKGSVPIKMTVPRCKDYSDARVNPSGWKLFWEHGLTKSNP